MSWFRLNEERMTVRMNERRQTLIITVALVFICSALSFYAGASGLLPQVSQRLGIVKSGAPAKLTAKPGVDLTQIERVQQYIQNQALETVPARKLTEGALKGMVEATGDKYSAYFSPEAWASFQQHFEPSFTGIGVHVETNAKTGLVTVVSPIKGSPGEQAGLKAGDAILSVDDKDITRMPLDQAVVLIKGPVGSKVRLTVRREGVSGDIRFSITRAIIDQPTVESKMLEPGVGYIYVTEFNKQVTERVTKAIADLRGQDMTRLILDLRGNPGGLLDEAVGMASLFAPPKEPVLTVVYRNGEKQVYRSRARARWDLPLVVLVDGGSASASEILAGAIKDLKLGTLMGVKTFGKGTVQSMYDLPNKDGIKLTTAKYLTAVGNSIHEKGIEPDVMVQNPQKVLPGEAGDVQLSEAQKYIKSLKR